MLKDPTILSCSILSLFVLGGFLYYCISFNKKLTTQRPLLKSAKSIYVRPGVRNFLIELGFAYIPLLFIYSVTCLILGALTNGATIRLMFTVGALLLDLFILVYILTISIVGDTYLIFIINDSLVLMSEVININNIAAFDFNESKKHIYINFVNDDGNRDMVKLRNLKSLLAYLKSNFDKNMFVS